MISHYPIVLEHESNGSVSAYVVGLPGVFAAAGSERAAASAIRIALASTPDGVPGTPRCGPKGPREPSCRPGELQSAIRTRSGFCRARRAARSPAEREEGCRRAGQRPERWAPSKTVSQVSVRRVIRRLSQGLVRGAGEVIVASATAMPRVCRFGYFNAGRFVQTSYIFGTMTGAR